MHEFRLKSVALKEIGVFDDMRIDFPASPVTEPRSKAEIHLFTGPNGCGKSTLLYALAEIYDTPLHGAALIEQRFRSTASAVAAPSHLLQKVAGGNMVRRSNPQGRSSKVNLERCMIGRKMPAAVRTLLCHCGRSQGT
jgi:predicted ATPase